MSIFRSQDVRHERAKPVIYNDLIYMISSRKKIVSFDLQGSRHSTMDIDFASVSSPVISDWEMYVGGDDGFFHCLDLKTGQDIWSSELRTLDFSTPVISGENVIFQTGNDRVLALDRESGDWRWEYQHLRGDDLAIRSLSTPRLKDGVVYVGLSGGSVVALETANGKLVWKTRVFRGEQFKDVDAPLEVDENSVFAVSISGELAALSRKTGKAYWKYDSGGMAGCVLDGDTIYLATDDAELVAIDKITGRRLWRTVLSDRETLRFKDLPTTPQVIDSYLITVSRNGKLYIMDKHSGEITSKRSFFTSTSSSVIKIKEDSGFLFIDDKGIVRLWILNPVNDT